LGSDSYFAEPYVIRSSHRLHVGDKVHVDRRVFLSVVEEYQCVRFEPELRIGDGTMIATDLLLHCAGGVYIGERVAISARAYIGDSFRDYADPGVPPMEMPIPEPDPVRICDGAFIGDGLGDPPRSDRGRARDRLGRLGRHT
jgi:acetyltransferase-like isoleucine patch superfamily enzyme